MDEERQRFEQWYATHALNHERDPIGSRDCGLQWAAWQAGSESHRAELAECREDAERWRYLRDDGCGFEITVREENEDGYESWVSGYPGAELDAAIDAARKGEGE